MLRLLVVCLVIMLVAPALAEDSRCQQLRALHQQYAGVARAGFTMQMRSFESAARAWYRKNCQKS